MFTITNKDIDIFIKTYARISAGIIQAWRPATAKSLLPRPQNDEDKREFYSD